MSVLSLSHSCFSSLARTAVALCGLLSLSTGCGDAAPGGVSLDGDSPEIAPPGSERGYLAGRVAGLAFETETVSGVTDDHGGFFYEPGQRVVFRLGDIVLGEAKGADFLSPFDLAGIQPITNGREGAREAGEAFHRVASILVLLETLDYDGDPGNGIEITDEVAALFEGAEVVLDKHSYKFRTDRGFREALNAANAERLLADHRAPRGPAPALDRLYGELGLSAGFYAHSVFERDDGGDGVIDDRVEREFDVHGFPARSLEWSVAEGTYEARYEVTDWGEVRFRSGDGGADGIVDSTTTISFDLDGNRTREEFDRDGDGLLDEVADFAHDEFGRRLSERRDRNADGVADSSVRWTYDDGVRSRTSLEDYDGDGAPDHVVVQFQAPNGKPVRIETDNDGDGAIDSVRSYRYDERGRTVEYWRDDHVDGTTDHVDRYEYDSRGRLFRQTQDDDDDGIPTLVETYYYDDEGRPTSIERDSDADGVIDAVESYQYYEAGDSPLGAPATLREKDRDNDGVVDSRQFSVFDANGALTMRFVDDDGDFSAEQLFYYTPVSVGWGHYFWD